MKTRARATDATHSDIKTKMKEKEATIKGNKRMRYIDTKSIAAGKLHKHERGAEEQNPYRAHLYGKKKRNENKTQK